MSTAVEDPHTRSSLQTLNSHLPDLAQRQLDALRAAVDVRLSALEAALADPARAGALETLVLDLARVATDEAQAAASKACVDTKLEVDTQMARAMASSQAAIQQERTTVAELRGAVEQARQQIASLERDKQTEIGNLRARFEAQIAHDGEVAGKLQRTLADTQAHLDAERRAAAELRQALEDAKKLSAVLAQEKAQGLEQARQQIASLERDKQTEIRNLRTSFEAQVAHDSEAAGKLQRTLADTQAHLDAERRAAAELRQALEDAKKLSAVLAQEKAQGLEQARQQITSLESDKQTEVRNLTTSFEAQVARDSEVAGKLQRTLADTQSQLDAERRAAAELRQALEDAKKLSAVLAQEKAQGLEQARQQITSLESDKQTEIRNLRTSFEAQVAHDSEAAGKLQRTLADTQAHLDAERRAVAELRQALEDAKGLSSAALAQEKAQGLELAQSLAGLKRSLDDTQVDVVREREKAGVLERTLTDRQAQLDVERRAAAELRQALEDAKRLYAVLAQEKAQGLELEQSLAGLKRLLDETQVDAAREREKVAALEGTLADRQAQLDAERRAAAELRRALEDAEALSTTVAREKGETLAAREELASRLSRETEAAARLQRNLAEAQSQLDLERASSIELREAADRVAERLTTIGPEIARILEAHDVQSTELDAARTRLKAFESERQKAPRKRETDPWSTTPASREGRTSVLLAERYVFRKPVEIQINGEPGLLIDLSVGGCQLVSRSALKLNQVLNVMLPPSGETTIICTGQVMWTRLETSGHRAGLQFTEADESAIQAFAAARSTV